MACPSKTLRQIIGQIGPSCVAQGMSPGWVGGMVAMAVVSIQQNLRDNCAERYGCAQVRCKPMAPRAARVEGVFVDLFCVRIGTEFADHAAQVRRYGVICNESFSSYWVGLAKALARIIPAWRGTRYSFHQIQIL